jgi:hypothetical protein
MKKNKILLWGALAMLGLFAFASVKVNQWQKILEKLKIVPTGFRELKIENWLLKFKIDITVFNNTIEDFSPVAGVVNLQKFVITDKNKNQLAQILVNQSAISIKAGQSQKFSNLQVEIPLNATNIISLSQIISLNEIKILAVAVTPFKTYYLEQ